MTVIYLDKRSPTRAEKTRRLILAFAVVDVIMLTALTLYLISKI